MDKIMGICGGLMLGSCFVANPVTATGFDCQAANQVFFSYTEKHDTAVQLCKLSEEQYSFTYGTITHPEIHYIQSIDNVSLAGSEAGGFAFRQDEMNYVVYLEDQNNGLLWIRHKQDVVNEIKLDLNFSSVVNRTVEMLEP